jgi:uncharacterized repeat protein (TIGR01451 family)
MRTRGVLSVLGAVAAVLASPSLASATTLDYTANTYSASIAPPATTETESFPEDNITVEPNVTVAATAGNVSFTSADSVLTGSGSVVSATGSVTIVAGSGDNDNDAGISIAGSIVASGNVTLWALGSSNVCIHSITAGGTVTIIAGGSINSCSGQATVSANALRLVASTGVGSGGSGLMTTVSHLGATTTTGNININNTGSVSLDQLSGIQVSGGSGGVNLVDSGSVSVQTNGDTISAPGSVFIQAVGATSDIATGGQASGNAITAGGSAFLMAGRDIVLGDANGYGSVQTAAGAILDAGRDVGMNANAVLSNFPNGNVDVQAGRNISMTTGTGTLAGAPAITTSGGGTVTVTTGPGGSLTAESNAAQAISAQNATVFVEADSATIGAGISSGIARTVLSTASAGQPINLGSKPGGALGLTQAELGLVTAGVLQVGSAAAGNLTISNPITSNGANFNVLTLVTGGSVIDGSSTESPIVTVPDLRIDAGKGIGTNDDIDTAVDALALGNGSGPVAITNQQPTTIGTVDGDTGIFNNGSTTTLISSGALSINQPIESGGAATLQASDTGAPGADLLLAPSASVTATSGDAVLLAGDNETINAGATVAAGGAVRLECDYGDANPFHSCTIADGHGGLTGSPVALRGGDDNGASFTVGGESLSGRGPLTITGAPGTNSTATVTGVSVTHSPGAGLALDNLTSAAITGGTFTGNTTDGVAVDSSSGVLISGDEISGNGGLGIDMLQGSNHGIAAPALSFAAPAGGSTEVKGTITGPAGHTYQLAFFDNPSCDASGFAEGQTALGTDAVSTDAGGHASFDVTLPTTSAKGDAIAATATDESSNETSAFSRCIQRADLGVAIAAAPSPGVVNGTLTYTVSVKNNGPNDSTGATVVDTLPAGVSFLSASPGCTDAAATVTCSAPAIAAGATASLTLTVRTPGNPGSLTDTATVAGREQDVNSANNSATSLVTITTPKPSITALTITPKRFKAPSPAAGAARRARGATVSYSDSMAGGTRFTVDHAVAGRMSGGKCGAASAHNRHSRRCTRFLPMPGSFTHTDVAGHDSLRFTGRIGTRTLARGNYRLDATPTAGGQTGPTAWVLFSIT